MSMRRPRVKALANLGIKRKAPIKKEEPASTSPKKFKEETNSSTTSGTATEQEQESLNTSLNVQDQDHHDQNGNEANHVTVPAEEIKSSFKKEAAADVAPFKSPFNLEKPIPDDNPSAVLTEDVIQSDLQKSANIHASPTKSRQRIKATPIFGNRRNSLVGSPNPNIGNLEDDPKREKATPSNVTFHNSFHYQKLAAAGVSRIRTESGCSTYSDSWSRDYSGKPKKGDEYRQPLSKREFQLKYGGKMPEKNALKMSDLIFYNPTTNPMEFKAPTPADDTKPVTPKIQVEEEKEPEGPILVPQLKLGLNGEMMIDEKSLEIETTAEKEARKTLANTSLIYLDENSGNNGFYKRQKRTKDWPPDETIKFYKCLHTVGTDFSLMLTLFPDRTRRDLKLKFKKEEKCNAHLINKALLFPKAFNIEELKITLEKDDQERTEKERLWREIHKKEGRQSTQAYNKSSKAARSLRGGDVVYNPNEFVPKNKLTTAAMRKTKPKKTSTKAVKKEPVIEKQDVQREEQEALNMLLAGETDLESIASPRKIETPFESNIVHHEDTVDSVVSSATDGLNIEGILDAINRGLLAIVSVANDDDADKVTTEICTINPNDPDDMTKLDLPDEIVNMIVGAMQD